MYERLIIFISLFLTGLYLGKPKTKYIVKEYRDTITICDTIRDTVLMPVDKYITRIDTAYLKIPNDTVYVMVLSFDR